MEVPAFSKGANAVLEELISSFGVADAHRVKSGRAAPLPRTILNFRTLHSLHLAGGLQQLQRRLIQSRHLLRSNPNSASTTCSCCRPR